MTNYTAKHLNDMQSSFGGGFVKARAELGVSSFGMQVIRMPPEHDGYPEHDHSHDSQEEVYLALEGSGWLEIAGERVELGKEVFVRVAPEVKRKVHPGAQGLSILVIGGCPGAVYAAPEMTELEPATA